MKDFCQEHLQEEENLSEEESEDDEKEEGSEAEQALQGGSFLLTENLGQSLHQEGESLGWERCLRWRRSWICGPIRSFPSFRLFCSTSVAPELPASSSR